MTPQDQGAASPAQEPALKPAELEAARKHCEKRASEIEAQTAKHGPGWWPEGVAHASALRTLLAVPVPPAAAPVGEAGPPWLKQAREELETAPDSNEKAGWADDWGTRLLDALAAAPVTGDPWPADDYERSIDDRIEYGCKNICSVSLLNHQAAYLRRLVREARAPVTGDRETADSDFQCGWSASMDVSCETIERLTAERDAALEAINPITGDRETAGVEPVAWALFEEGQAQETWAGPWRPKYPGDEDADLRPLYLATPPSGGGDHAGGEAARDWVNCPICGESDMQREGGLVRCVNLACGSNGGTNFNARATAAPASGVFSEEAFEKAWTAYDESKDDDEPMCDLAGLKAAILAYFAASPKAQGSVIWNEEPTPEQSAEIENNDGPLSRGQLHPWDFYKIIRAAGPKAQGSDVGLRDELQKLFDTMDAVALALPVLETMCFTAGLKAGEDQAKHMRQWVAAALSSASHALAASRTGQKGAGS